MYAAVYLNGRLRYVSFCDVQRQRRTAGGEYADLAEPETGPSDAALVRVNVTAWAKSQWEAMIVTGGAKGRIPMTALGPIHRTSSGSARAV
jgi:hypothetical protein